VTLETKGHQILPSLEAFLKKCACEGKKPAVPWQSNVHSWKDKKQRVVEVLQQHFFKGPLKGEIY